MTAHSPFVHLLRRWAFAFALLAATYNPTGWCYLSWVQNRPDLPASIVVVFGSALVAGYVYLIRGALGGFGHWATFALFGFLWALLWALSDYNIIPKNAGTLWVWLALVVTSITLAVAISWPKLRKGGLFGAKRLAGSKAKPEASDPTVARRRRPRRVVNEGEGFVILDEEKERSEGGRARRARPWRTCE